MSILLCYRTIVSDYYHVFMLHYGWRKLVLELNQIAMNVTEELSTWAYFALVCVDVINM